MVKTENLCFDNLDIKLERSSSSKIQKNESKSSKIKLSRNPFINFIKDFRKSVTFPNSRLLFSKAGEAWRGMSQDEKNPYYEQAKKVPKRKKRINCIIKK